MEMNSHSTVYGAHSAVGEVSWAMEAYQAAHESAGFFRRHDPGFLRLKGEDAIAFLQRQTTNDLRTLSKESVVVTVLTTATARIQDVLIIVPMAEELGAICLDGYHTATTGHFRGKIFFMDKVEVVDASDQVVQIEIIGPRAAESLGEIGIATPTRPEGIARSPFGEHTITAISAWVTASSGYRILFPQAGAEAIEAHLRNGNIHPISSPLRHILRLEDGMPGVSSELTEDYNPLEANLGAFISDTKGCYTGQEVIARQITYDKVTKHLVRLRLAGPVTQGSGVISEGKQVGEVTSYAESPSLGPIALAYLKRPFSDPGTPVSVELTAGAMISAVVDEFPRVR